MHSLKSLSTALLMTLALAFATSADGQMRGLEQSYEVSPGQIVLPSSPGGGLVLRKCPTCAPATIATNANTLYTVGAESIPLQDFAAVLREDPNVQVTVMTTMRGDLITRLRVAALPPTRASTR
jgi:hypothetical protein